MLNALYEHKRFIVKICLAVENHSIQYYIKISRCVVKPKLFRKYKNFSVLVFVIISTLLIQWFGWQWVDPLCSLILSVLILGSVCPLLESSASVLLQSVPDEIHSKLDEIAEEVKLNSQIIQ